MKNALEKFTYSFLLYSDVKFVVWHRIITFDHYYYNDYENYRAHGTRKKDTSINQHNPSTKIPGMLYYSKNMRKLREKPSS